MRVSAYGRIPMPERKPFLCRKHDGVLFGINFFWVRALNAAESKSQKEARIEKLKEEKQKLFSEVSICPDCMRMKEAKIRSDELNEINERKLRIRLRIAEEKESVRFLKRFFIGALVLSFAVAAFFFFR